VDNPVDNLWITPPFSTPVDNWGVFPQVIHKGTSLIHRSYPQAVSAPRRYFPPFIHVFNSFKKKNSSSNRRRWRKKWKSN
ncbi:MAG: hypothetical protein ACUVQC_03220, partial [Thermaceae bacterium]